MAPPLRRQGEEGEGEREGVFGGRKATAGSDAEDVEGGPVNGLFNNTSNPRLKMFRPISNDFLLFFFIQTYEI